MFVPSSSDYYNYFSNDNRQKMKIIFKGTLHKMYLPHVQQPPGPENVYSKFISYPAYILLGLSKHNNSLQMTS